MALYFECQINKNALLQPVFGDFAHWARLKIPNAQTNIITFVMKKKQRKAKFDMVPSSFGFSTLANLFFAL